MTAALPPLGRIFDALFNPGRVLFALAILAIGRETLTIARIGAHPLGTNYNSVSVIPWLPAIPWLAYLFGLIWLACAVGLLSDRTLRSSALILGTLYFLAASSSNSRSMSLTSPASPCALFSSNRFPSPVSPGSCQVRSKRRVSSRFSAAIC